MKLQLASTPWTQATGDWLIVGVPEAFDLEGPLGALDQALSGQIARLRESQDLSGKLAESVSVPAPAGIRAKRLLLIGLGPADKISDSGLHKALMTAARTVSAKKTERIAVAIPTAGPAEFSLARRVQNAATAFTVGCVGQDLYRAEKKRFPFDSVDLLVEPGQETAEMKAALEAGTILGDAINLTRELVNQPPKVIYPASFARRAEELAASTTCAAKCSTRRPLKPKKWGRCWRSRRGAISLRGWYFSNMTALPPGRRLWRWWAKGSPSTAAGCRSNQTKTCSP